MHKNATKLENLGLKTANLNNRKPNRLIENKNRLFSIQKPTSVNPTLHMAFQTNFLSTCEKYYSWFDFEVL